MAHEEMHFKITINHRHPLQLTCLPSVPSSVMREASPEPEPSSSAPSSASNSLPLLLPSLLLLLRPSCASLYTTLRRCRLPRSTGRAAAAT